MSTSDFDQSVWRRAIGKKATEPPNEWLNGIRPVVQIADFSSLTAAHQPPAASYGGLVPAVLLRSSAITVLSRDPGGVFVVDVAASFAGPTVLRWTTISGVSLLANPVVHPPRLFSTAAPQSTVTSGDIAAPLAAATHPGSNNAALPGFPFGGWLPPGFSLLLVVDPVNTALPAFALTLVGVPVIEGGDGLP